MHTHTPFLKVRKYTKRCKGCTLATCCILKNTPRGQQKANENSLPMTPPPFPGTQKKKSKEALRKPLSHKNTKNNSSNYAGKRKISK